MKLSRAEAMTVLKQFFQEKGEEYGLIAIGIFGSVARDEAKDSSDVDVVVQMKQPNLFTMAGIKLDLEERFRRHVDIIQYRERMNPFLKKRIEEDVHYV
ncbi:MAG: nucleotidyltransferase domain-containing protein [Kiritimatiellales bacterium]